MVSPCRYDVVIIGGFGHVGLPLGIVLAEAGLRVGLLDRDSSKRAAIEAGQMPFIEYDAEPILQQVIHKTLFVVDSLAAVSESDLVIITIGTPIDEYLNPRMKPLFELSEHMAPYLRDDQCVILRSTVCPGATQSLSEFFRQKSLAVHLAYCPERIVQAYAIRELRKLPQIISGFSDQAVNASDVLFRRLGVETIRVTVQEAEFSKLFSNAWRYIQFAITNQFYMIATEHGADYAQIHRAMTHNYERAANFPKAGFAAGPCLLKDTLQLAAAYGNHFQLGHAAMMINEGLPNFVIARLSKDCRSELTGVRVGVLGMAFKADCDDVRDSLSYKLVKVLRFQGALVSCSDEFVKDAEFISKEALISGCDVVVVAVPHSAYRGLNIPSDKVVFDLWGIVSGGRPALQSRGGVH